MKETGISTAVQGGYNNLDGREEGRIIRANVEKGGAEEMKSLNGGTATTRNLHLHHQCSRISRETTRYIQDTIRIVQVTGLSWSQDMTQKD